MSVVLKDIEDLLGAKLPINETENLLQTLSGLSLDSEFCDQIISEHPVILMRIVKNYIMDQNECTIAALDFFINITSHPGFSLKMCNIKLDENDISFSGFLGQLMQLMISSNDAHVKSKAAQLMSNMTREHNDIFEHLVLADSQALDNIFRIGLLLSASVSEEHREDAAMIILNLSKETSGQKFIMKNLHFFNDLIEIMKVTSNEKWEFACYGLIKNLLKNSDFHDDLMEKTDILTILLHSLVGLNKYEKKTIDSFPEKLKQFIGKPKQLSSDLRCVILEALYLLSATKSGRECMRTSNTYDILKNISEMDLTDEESDNCVDCIGLLIRYEHEINCEDLLNLKIPKDVEEKFQK